jgi:hypothetical protein
MTKVPNFNIESYNALIDALKESNAASIPVALNLDGQNLEITAPFNSSCAPKAPTITFKGQEGDIYFFHLQELGSGFESQIFVKYNNFAVNQAAAFSNAADFKSLDYKEKINYCNVHKIKISYKLKNFVLTTQISGDESCHTGNIATLKNNSKTFYKDGSIFFCGDGKIASGNSMLYVVDKKGALYISPSSSEYGAVHHSYILKSKIADHKLYGYGKPTASAGHITINDQGKITEIDNSSGHYLPSFEQTLLVTKYFKQFGIIDEACVVKGQATAEAVSYTDINTINTEEILGRYLDITDIYLL